MQITQDTPTVQATVQGVQLDFPQPFAEGQTINANEASALNQLLKENGRNNFAGKVKAAKLEAYRETSGNKEAKNEDVPEEFELTDAQIETLASEFATYINSYEFGVRAARGESQAKTPLEKEMYKVAASMLRAALKLAGQKVKDIGGEEAFDNAVQALVDSNPDVKAEAERRLAAVKDVAAVNLADLGIKTAPAAQ